MCIDSIYSIRIHLTRKISAATELLLHGTNSCGVASTNIAILIYLPHSLYISYISSYGVFISNLFLQNHIRYPFNRRVFRFCIG